ncbi:MAG TPA: thiamine phosphate synthase [Gemmatimonadaceae bacterium]|nr:thiamine phosphate synthase [Gemmatimonadaceae bacterium]
MLVVPVIHAVTDDLILAHPEFTTRARGVMHALGPRGAVHLRARYLTAAQIYALALALGDAQESTGCWLVVNERLDVALAARTHAAQLTTRSLTVADARLVAGELPLGASVHSAVEALVAQRDGADWVVAGHVFPTASHSGMPGRGAELVAAVAATTTLPCIAIGGVRPANVGALRDAGAYGVAAITGIWGAASAEAAASDYLSHYDGARGQS